jgi:hypothetical protein
VSRRNKLRGVALSIAHSFSSRNNDLNGYWAMGILCAHAIATKHEEVNIDLLGMEISPANDELRPIAEHYSKLLAANLAGQRVASDAVVRADVSARFDIEPDAKRALGELPFVCTVTLGDQQKNQATAEASGSCWPHSPLRESRRLFQNQLR